MTISILCGGSGTRLFPLSRELLPKQFANLLPSKNAQTSSHSLFQETLLRNDFLRKSHKGKFQIITNDNHYFIAQEQAHKINIPFVLSPGFLRKPWINPPPKMVLPETWAMPFNTFGRQRTIALLSEGRRGCLGYHTHQQDAVFIWVPLPSLLSN